MKMKEECKSCEKRIRYKAMLNLLLDTLKKEIEVCSKHYISEDPITKYIVAVLTTIYTSFLIKRDKDGFFEWDKKEDYNG